MAFSMARSRVGGPLLRTKFGLQCRQIQTFTLPELPYDYNALEPIISAEIMWLHHQKHHQAYVTNYNKALEQLDVATAKGDAEATVFLQSAIKFNGGGHINHSIFWKILAPVKEGGGEPPKGGLAQEIDTQFGSLDVLTQKVNAVGAAVQGSGWVWLGWNKDLKRLVVETTQNQVWYSSLPPALSSQNPVKELVSYLFWWDPLVTKGLLPLFGIDVWEHAYYLQYKNVRPDYLKNIWKVLNWKYVEEVFEKEIES